MKKHEDRTGKIQLALVILFIISAFAASAMLSSEYEAPDHNKADERVAVVEAQTMTPAPHRVSFSTSGIVQARGVVSITPQVSGRIVMLDDAVYPGGSFKKKNLLFRIDPRDYQIAKRQAEAQLASAETAYALAKAESEAAIAEWEQMNAGTSAPDLVAREPQLKEAKASIEAAKATLEQANIHLERTEFSYPFIGRIVESTLAVGQYVQAGQSYGSVYNSSLFEVRVSLDQQQLQWLSEAGADRAVNTGSQKGAQAATITLSIKQPKGAKPKGASSPDDSLLKKTYKGRVLRLASELESSTRFGVVYLGFEDSLPTKVLPGTFVDVAIEGKEYPSVLLLPSSAMQSAGYVWRITGENTLTAWKPTILYTGRDVIAVIHDMPVRVVTNRLASGVEGMKVSISNQ